MRKWFKRANKKIIDWIKFDSPEEIEVYKALLNWNCPELVWAKLIRAKPEPFLLYKWFKAWPITIRKRVYTHDFDIEFEWKKVALEVKSKWTESKPDYRLRRAIFLFLYSTKVNFAELIKIRKWVWELRKYY